MASAKSDSSWETAARCVMHPPSGPDARRRLSTLTHIACSGASWGAGGSAVGARLGGQGGLDLQALAVAQDGQGDVVAGVLLADVTDEGVGRLDALTVAGDDDVADLEPGRGGGGAGAPRADLGAGAGGRAVAGAAVLRGAPEVGVGRGAVVDELLGDRGRLVDRDREADADAARLAAGGGAQRRDGRVDADQLAAGVDEGATAVAGVDRRGRL